MSRLGDPAVQVALKRAVDAIRGAESLIVTAGAGMGVDSGLPDFRGPEGFWRAYPPLRERNIVLEKMSNPQWFKSDPEFAWGFFGHRHNLYSRTQPHQGFNILRSWCERMRNGYFVFTSNVDGHFQKSGFPEDKVVECHGSIKFMQCADDTIRDIWPVSEDVIYDVDMTTLKLKCSLPMGPPSNPTTLARPNILMFSDFNWVSDRCDEQTYKYEAFLESIHLKRAVVVEIGAGLAVPTVRCQSESLAARGATLIRINPNEPEVPYGQISLPLKGLECLSEIDAGLKRLS